MRRNFINDGKAFEKELEKVFAEYQFRGIMRLAKVDPPTRIIGPGRIVYLENPFLDYCGSWTKRGGRAIFIEAKSTKQDKMSVGKESGLRSQQWEQMRHWNRAGAVVFMLWKCGDGVALFTPEGIQSILDEKSRINIEDGQWLWPGKGNAIWDIERAMEESFP